MTDRSIGILIAVGCLAAVVMQQFLGRLVDTGRLEGKTTLLCLTAIQCAVGSIMTGLNGSGSSTALFGILLFCTIAMQPILNALAFYYQHGGIPINYGIARGIGSLCYSGCSMLMGLLTVRLGSFIVPMSFGILGAVVCFSGMMMMILSAAGSTLIKKNY